jgi:hypothetical protein
MIEYPIHLTTQYVIKRWQIICQIASWTKKKTG